MNKMRLYMLILSVVLVFSFGSVYAQDDSALPNLEGRTIQAVTENLFPPFNFERVDTSQGVGFEYDLTEEICSLLNCTIEWNIIGFDAMIAAVGDGQFDVGMDGITINEERDEIVDFSNKYITTEQFLLVRADEDRFANAEELAADESLLIGVQPGTTPFFTAVFDVLGSDLEQENPRLILFDNFALQVQALLNGDIDATITDSFGAIATLDANPGQLKTVGGPLISEDLGYIFPNGSDLVEPFNQALAYLQETGYIDYLNTKWFVSFNADSLTFATP